MSNLDPGPKLAVPLMFRWQRWIENRDRIVKHNFVVHVIEEGRKLGFNLTNGDRCFIHPSDLPKNCHLGPGDPVIVSTRPAVIPGRLFYAKGAQLPQALESPPIMTSPTPEQ